MKERNKFIKLLSVDRKMEKIKGPNLDKDLSIQDLVSSMSYIGFQATELGKSVEVLKKINEN